MTDFFVKYIYSRAFPFYQTIVTVLIILTRFFLIMKWRKNTQLLAKRFCFLLEEEEEREKGKEELQMMIAIK